MFHIYYCINYISYYLYEEKSLLHDKLAEKGFPSSPDCPGYCPGTVPGARGPGFPTYAVKIYPYIIHFEVQF